MNSKVWKIFKNGFKDFKGQIISILFELDISLEIALNQQTRTQ